MFTSSDILQLTFSDPDLVKRIKTSNILLVGAGGIGCEVLKGLLLAGFPSITIIDLDTIDVSNLNRQFLYNRTHVGKSKAEVAAHVSVERFSHRENGQPISNVVPIHDSILNLKYDRNFYQQFTFVINALDNNATRVHVNRLCLAADLPLIESGSGGYLGNITLIKGGVTKCFECVEPKKDENTYGSCTIRNTPSKPIHCVVWAKHLFAQLFGECDEDISPDYNVINQNSSGSDDQQHNSQTTRQFVESNDYDPKLIFDKIFYHDILYLKQMKHLWENRCDRREPQELLYDKIINKEDQFNDVSNNNQPETISNGNMATTSKWIADQCLWSMDECLKIFVNSLSKLKQRFKEEHCLEWDKDDETIVDFVSAVSNFRCYCFYIQRKSKFEVKSLAGNIIPAISSTNTIVGGYVLLLTIRLLSSLLPERFSKEKLSRDQIKIESKQLLLNGFSIFLTNKNRKNLRKIAIESLLPPNPNCIACSGCLKEIIIELPFNKIFLADLIEQIVMRKFKTVAPDIHCYERKKMIYAADDEEELKNPNSYYRNIKLNEIFTDNICLTVQDLEQDFKVNLRLKNSDFALEQELNDGELFRIINPHEMNLNNQTQNEILTNNDTNGVKKNNRDEILPEGSLKRVCFDQDSSASSPYAKKIINIEDEEVSVCPTDQHKLLPPQKRIKISEN